MVATASTGRLELPEINVPRVDSPDQIGHTSAAFTLQVYQQTRKRRLTDKERQAIWELMRFADEPAECPFTRQITRGADREFRPVNRPTDDFDPSDRP
ncbi:MAG: hypothetical protein ABSG95_12815 [Solirubrobacteraceae bacterium]